MTFKKKTEAAKEKLWNTVKEWIDSTHITSQEIVYQSDRAIENSYELMDKVSKIVGYADYRDTDTD